MLVFVFIPSDTWLVSSLTFFVRCCSFFSLHSGCERWWMGWYLRNEKISFELISLTFKAITNVVVYQLSLRSIYFSLNHLKLWYLMVYHSVKAHSVLFLFSLCCLIFSCFSDCCCCRLVSTAQKPRLATFLLHVIQQNLGIMLARTCFIFASHTLLKYREYPLKGSSSRCTLLLAKTQWAVVAEVFTISSSTNSAGMRCVYVLRRPPNQHFLFLSFPSSPFSTIHLSLQ